MPESGPSEMVVPRVPSGPGPGSRETINHPSHYGGDTTYEAIKVIRAWGLGFSLGNAAKYICRAGKKGTSQIEDLKKARWYIDEEIRSLEYEVSHEQDF